MTHQWLTTEDRIAGARIITIRLGVTADDGRSVTATASRVLSDADDAAWDADAEQAFKEQMLAELTAAGEALLQQAPRLA